MSLRHNLFIPFVACLIALSVTACSPTVKVQAPDKPIEINLNVKIQQEVRVKVERDLEDAFMDDPDLFGVPTSTTQEGN